VKVDGEMKDEGEMKVFLSPCIPLFIDIVKEGETKGALLKEDSSK
jgi:hypothetical protein